MLKFKLVVLHFLGPFKKGGNRMEISRADLIVALRKIDPQKPYGQKLFDALARLTVSVALEAVCLRLNSQSKKIEVYLARRSNQESAYPGEWHCPGTVIRPGEEFSSAFERLNRKEFGAKFLETRFVANVNHPTEARGHFVSMVYLCVVGEGTKRVFLRGKWFPVDELPGKLVEFHQKMVIPVAIRDFLALPDSFNF